MEGYLWKRRFYQNGKKKGVLRQRYCLLDIGNEVICFKTKKEEEKVHKHVELEEISCVLEFGDHGFIVVMRHVATHEACGAAFLFEVAVDGQFEGCDQQQSRDKWVGALKGMVNSINTGLDLVIKKNESIHAKYKLSAGPRTLLGTGMSGDVRLIQRKSDDKSFAMKTIRLSNITPARLGSLRREIDILKSLDHAHIARLQETYMEPRLYCRFVLELCEGGELFHRLNSRGHFSERYAGKLLATMLKALNYLHVNMIVHRDLKLENWLFRKPELATCTSSSGKGDCAECGCITCEDADLALIDFGLSRRIRSNEEEMRKKVGTSYYVAPEVLSECYTGTTCDMWSVGVIGFMLLSGHAPFDAATDEKITQKIKCEAVPDIENVKENSVWFNISPECKSFMKCILEKDPKKRLTAKQALCHPWIENILNLNHTIHTEMYDTGHVINDSVLERLKNFTKYKEVKRLAMEVIAFSLNHNEIKELTDLFEEIDTDHDGYIQLEELVTALKDYDNLDRAEIELIFNALDEEHNGKVHVNEFVAGALQAKYHLDEHFLQEAFERLDVGKKGKVTIEDLKRVLGRSGNEERILKIWEQSGLAEKSHTEEISFNEFLIFMRTDGEKEVQDYRKQSKTLKLDQVEMSELQLAELNNEKGRKVEGKASQSSHATTKSNHKLKKGFKPLSRMRKMFSSKSPKPTERP